jgi:hypothetical protein
MRRTAFGVLLLIAVAGVWIGLRGLQARQQLAAASSGIAQVRLDLLAADPSAAQLDARGAMTQAANAYRDTHDPVWTLVGHIPWLGDPVQTVEGVTAVSRNLTDQAFPVLVRTAGVVSSQRIKVADGSVNLAVLGSQAGPLHAADVDVARQFERAQALSPSWLGAVASARTRLVTELAPLAGEVHSASVTASVGPSMLGADGPRNYFVAFQNDAEARGTGGIAGAFVILHAQAGRLTVTARGSDADLRSDLPAVHLDQQLSANLAILGGTSDWREANVGADFPAAAQVWVQLWQEQTGQRLDGAFAVDPAVLSYLLSVTGPATLLTGQTVTSSNAVALTEQSVYANYSSSDLGDRKSFLQLVSSATISKVLSAPSSDGPGILEALRLAAGQRRLLLYSTTPSDQAELQTTAAGGALPGASQPTAVATLVNASANKIDFYVSSHLTYKASSCAAGFRDVTVTLTITNDAPTSGLPSYVTARLDGGTGPLGSEESLVSYYATTGAQVSSATLDGTASAVAVSSLGGHPVFSLPMTLLPGGATRTLVLHLTEPVLAGPVQTRPQPLVQPQLVTVDAPVCRAGA